MNIEDNLTFAQIDDSKKVRIINEIVVNLMFKRCKGSDVFGAQRLQKG